MIYNSDIHDYVMFTLKLFHTVRFRESNYFIYLQYLSGLTYHELFVRLAFPLPPTQTAILCRIGRFEGSKHANMLGRYEDKNLDQSPMGPTYQ